LRRSENQHRGLVRLRACPVVEAQIETAGVVDEVQHARTRPRRELLDADGTLSLEPGIPGTLAVTGCRLTTPLGGAPIFSAAGNSDDDNWQPGSRQREESLGH
jgi:hypothetical protein